MLCRYVEVEVRVRVSSDESSRRYFTCFVFHGDHVLLLDVTPLDQAVGRLRPTILLAVSRDQAKHCCLSFERVARSGSSSHPSTTYWDKARRGTRSTRSTRLRNDIRAAEVHRDALPHVQPMSPMECLTSYLCGWVGGWVATNSRQEM